MEEALVSSVTHESSTAVLKVYPLPNGHDVLAQLFTELAKKGIVVDIITQSQGEVGQRLAFSIPVDDIDGATQILAQRFSKAKVETMKDVSKVSIVGVGMRNHPGVASKFFQVLADLEVTVHLVTTSEIKVSVIIDKAKLEKAAQGLHRAFDLDA